MLALYFVKSTVSSDQQCHFIGIAIKKMINNSRGKTKRVSQTGVLMPKPMAVSIKLIPRTASMPYVKRPNTRNAPPIKAVQEVYHDAKTIKYLGIPLFIKVFSYV